MTPPALPREVHPVPAVRGARRSGPEAAPPAPRRILLLEANEDGTVGGSHQALYDLVRHLDRTRYEPVLLFYQENRFAAQLREEGFEVHLYSGVRAAERTVHASGRRLAKLREVAAAVRRRALFLREHRIDLVHVNNSPKVGNDDWLPATRLLRVPCIANAMGDAGGERGWRRLLFRGFDHVIPISRYLEEGMRRAGYGPERSDLVYLGIDLEAFRARVRRDAAEVRRELGVAPECMLVAMVGNIRPWKGQHVVLQALERLPASARRGLHVAFVGATGPEYEDYHASLEGTIASAGLRDCTSFLGGRTDVPELVNAADATLHASVKPEPFGLVVLEGMALGKAVVAADTGGSAEIVAPGTGLLYDVRDPEQLAAILRRLAEQPALRRSLGAAALQRVQDFTIQRTTAGTERIYARLLEPSRPR